MASAETEMGFSYGSIAYNVQRGLQEFEGQPYTGIRAVANIHDAPLNIVTLQRSSFRTLDDLVGRRVSIGPRGSGSASVAEEFLTSIGLFDQMDIQYLSFADSASSLRDGFIDAFIIGGSSPIPTLIELESTNPIRLISVEPDRVSQFLESYPYHVEVTIPAGIYSTVNEPVTAIGYNVIWVARDDVPEWVIYEMLTEMFSEGGRSYLQNVQLAFREMTPGIERFRSIDLPLHPGAEQYYREQGLLN
jgi:TRAP transporter TAXI family solute receptor